MIPGEGDLGLTKKIYRTTHDILQILIEEGERNSIISVNTHYEAVGLVPNCISIKIVSTTTTSNVKNRIEIDEKKKGSKKMGQDTVMPYYYQDSVFYR